MFFKHIYLILYFQVDWIVENQGKPEFDAPLQFEVAKELTPAELQEKLKIDREKAKILQQKIREQKIEEEKQALLEAERKRREMGKMAMETQEKYKMLKQQIEREEEKKLRQKDIEEKKRLKKEIEHDRDTRKAERLLKEKNFEELAILEKKWVCFFVFLFFDVKN